MKTHNDSRTLKAASRKKAQAALALAVSLWIAGGGVASAAGILFLDASNNDEIWHSNVNLPSNPTKDGKTLTVTGGTWTDWSIYGGSYSSLGETYPMKDYTLNLNGIKSEKASDQAQGARTASGNGASGNCLNMTNSDFKGYVYGAYVSASSGNVTSNHVTIKGSTVGSDTSRVVGGYADSGNAGGTGTNEGNSVTVENSTINAGIYGGYSYSGSAIGNSVTIKGASATANTINGTIYGGYVYNNNYGGGNGSATSNSVTIDGATVDSSIFGGKVETGSGGSATGNHVTIRNATVSYDVYGGSASSVTTGNTVTLHNATVNGNVNGGSGGGSSTSQNQVKGNMLQLSGVNEAKNVQRFETIALTDTLQWAPGNTDTPTLKVSYKIFGYGLGDQQGSNNLNLDVSAVAKKWTTHGTMVLIKATELPDYIYLNGDIGQNKHITTHGITVYQGAQTKSDDGSGVTLEYKNTHTVINERDTIKYDVQNIVNTITLGTVKWNSYLPTARTVSSGSAEKLLLFKSDVISNRQPPILNATNLSFTCNNASFLPKKDDKIRLLGYDKTFTIKEVQGRDTYPMAYTDTTGVQFNASAAGTFEYDGKDLNYKITGDVALDSIDLAKWNGTGVATVPDAAKWPAADSGVTVLTDGMAATKDLPPGETRTIVTATANYFANATISGEHQWTEGGALDTTPVNGVALAGATTAGGVKADDADKSTLIYRQPKRTVTGFTLGEMNWGESRDGSSVSYFYTGATVNADGLAFANPETIAAGSTTLLEANDTLADFSAQTKNLSYENYSPVPGVTLNGQILGSYAAKDGKITYTATANNATKLTFGDVEWKDSGALLDHTATLTNVSFDGADVDTTNINFTNLRELKDNEKMTLVSSFGNKVGAITGTKYKVGSTLEGEGKASLVGSDLIFTAETGMNNENLTAQEQTHNTVMGATVSMAALSAGNDFVGAATEGLTAPANVGADGVSSFAQMGGGSMRQETGSHVDTHTWNAILALGHQNKKERGAFEYGAFFEYGSGNYSTFNGDERGDGSMHYTGGGLLAKWTANHGMYVEGSLRAGSVHDDARNVLRDDKGVPYSYETNAPYMGFHLGVGKEIAVAGGNAVDVYGKYFYNRRNGVSFDAGGHYDLDAVTSSVLRVGARYILKRNKWNFYAGAAYEHEFDGKAGGTADGVAIRGADTSGASFRGEIGATVKPGENSPWNIDFNVTGFAGKKQGFTGGVSVAFMF